MSKQSKTQLVLRGLETEVLEEAKGLSQAFGYDNLQVVLRYVVRNMVNTRSMPVFDTGEKVEYMDSKLENELIADIEEHKRLKAQGKVKSFKTAEDMMAALDEED